MGCLVVKGWDVMNLCPALCTNGRLGRRFSSSSWIEWGFQIRDCSFCCAFVHELTASSRLVHLGTNVRLSKIHLVQLFIVMLHQYPYQNHTDHTKTVSIKNITFVNSIGWHGPL